ncbi:MAG TPA: gephyrin-like molybdotransferase Glp [Acetobacteraceae bacterium]|nr:gephyrin-like molybdotransferase Glp [Acetobacteraceae bacterium]
MTQLSNDCFAFGGGLLAVEDGIRRISERVEPVATTETASLFQADGRVLAEDVVAPIDLPPWDNAAVDGYAVRHADLAEAGATVLPVEGRDVAGEAMSKPLAAGTSRRIFTGARLPAGADTIFMQEDVETLGSQVRLPPGLRRGANTRQRGEDVPSGTVALPQGRRVRPQDIALAAALGLTQLAVRRRLRVAIFSTGNELATPGHILGPGQIFDSNRFLLASLVVRAGATPTDLGILPDDPAATAQALNAAASDHDLLLTSGGVSTGEEDHVRAAIESVGRLVFWRLAIKPGRPVAMGVVNGIPFAGLPGNPVATFITFVHVVRPLIARLAGEIWDPPIAFPVRSGFAYRKKSGRREYVRVRLGRMADGALEAQKHAQEGAGILSSLTATHGLVEVPEAVTAVAAGDVVSFLSYGALI